MSYQITPVDFENGVPENEEICQFIERNSSQRVRIENREFSGQFSIFFVDYPKDVLEFCRNDNNIVIYGDFGTAPALSEIFYSTLISLGGAQRYELDLVNFPVSDEFIQNKNREVRTSVRKFASIIWGVIILALIGVGSLIYFFVSWVINA